MFVLERSLSEDGMVTPYECFVGACYVVGVGAVGIILGVFSRVTRWCVCGAVRIWYGAVGVNDVWLVVVGDGAMFSVVVPKQFASCFYPSPCRPLKFWFSFPVI